MFFVIDNCMTQLLYTQYQKVLCVENVRRIYQYNGKLPGAENHVEGGCTYQFGRLY